MTRLRVCRVAVLVLTLVLVPQERADAQDAGARHAVRGLVLKVDRPGRTLMVSHEAVPGVMPAMAMPFEVHDVRLLDGIDVGTMVEFTMVVEEGTIRAEGVRIRHYEPSEQDPLTAARLRLLADIMRPRTMPRMVGIDQAVPDFTLTNQAERRISLSSLRGRIVVVNFVYTSCALPQFCYRTANHFGALQRRFADRLPHDLVFLTITFDAAVDRPDALSRYAAQWKAVPGAWHFLTGDADEVRAVCDLFGVDFFPDEGLMNHNVRTAVIDRAGRLVANVEGNQYTTAQLGDLVETALGRDGSPSRP